MKIARCKSGETVRWAVLDFDRDLAIPLKGDVAQWSGDCQKGNAGRWLELESAVSLSQVNLLAPVETSSKIICAGLNYRRHVEALGNTMPDTLIAFIKAPTAVIAHEQPIVYPRLTQKLDYEIELVVVIGQTLPPSGPPVSAVLGYTIGNDVTGRDLTKGPRGADLYSSKSLDNTCGIGPWVTTADEIGIGQLPDLRMTLRVNGEVRQDDRSTSMEWDLNELLTYVNTRTRLLPGDLLFTGTPAGVALEDGRFLRPGDIVECEIEKIGTLRNTVIATKENTP